MNSLLFILSTIGLTNIVVHGKIMDVIGLRPWLKATLSEGVFGLFECYECTGFWSGIIMGMTIFSIDPLIFIPCGFAGSVISSFYNDFVYLVRSKTEYEVGDD